ncbi:MAG: hypothetical protein ACRDD1_09240 [Planctomycetia bacterium]
MDADVGNYDLYGHPGGEVVVAVATGCMTPDGGGERTSESQTVGETVWRILTPYFPGLTPRCQVRVDDGRILEIQRIAPTLGVFLEVWAVERTP